MERLCIYQTATEEKNKIETKFRKHTDEEKLFAEPGVHNIQLGFRISNSEHWDWEMAKEVDLNHSKPKHMLYIWMLFKTNECQALQSSFFIFYLPKK